MINHNEKQVPPSIKKTDYTSMLLGSTAAGLAVGTATLWLSWHDLPWLPAPAESLSFHMRFWLDGALSHLTKGVFGTTAWHEYLAYLNRLSSSGYASIISFRVWTSIISGTTSALYFGWKLSAPRDALIHIRGRRFYQGSEAIRLAKKESRIECKQTGNGILLHPEIPMSVDRETRHILVMGAVGSGKTQMIWHLLNLVIQRGDRAIIYDNKGEFTAGIKSCILFAPWDSRSSVWDIASDCRSKQNARDLAAQLIPANDKDPMWSNASRAILTGMIVSLQVTKEFDWGFRDIADLIPLPIAEIHGIMKKYNPEGMRSVEDASRTTQSILINLSAFMSVIFDLADAWGDVPKERRFSLRSWLENSTRKKVLILQGDNSNRQLAHAYINGMISCVSGMVCSPNFQDSTTRKIWVFLDEMAQIGKLDNISPMLEVGRSKGVRVVIGTQDIAQLRNLYGQHNTEAWASMIGTSIYGRMAGGETAEWISKRIGSREVERPNEVWSYRDGKPTCSTSYVKEKIQLVIPSQLQSELGAKDGHVSMLLDGFSNGVYQIDYPMIDVKKIRKSHIPLEQQKKLPTAAQITVADESEAAATAAPLITDKSEQPKRKFRRRDEPDHELQSGEDE